MKTKIQTLTAAMTDSISNVLETMFFLSLDISGAVSIKSLQVPENDAMMAARLNFSGPVSGHCVFYIPRKLAMSMTADFLGVDEQNTTDEQTQGTVKEIINMLVGDTFSNFDSQAVFNLEIPEMVSFEETLGVDPAENEIVVGIDTLEDHLAYRMVITP